MALNLDYNAGCTLLPEVADQLRAMLGDYAQQMGSNPSSIHSSGQKARAMIEEARADVANLAGVGSDAKVIFTSGATEASSTALYYSFWDQFKSGSSKRSEESSYVSSKLEHPSILETFSKLEKLGVSGDLLAHTESAPLDLQSVLAKLGPQTKLVSLMLANNETGEIFPVGEICQGVKSYSSEVLFHTDAVQTLGRVELSFAQLGVDMMSLSGHKIGALPGIGALIVRKDLYPSGMLKGGPQEFRWRAGTENVPGILSFGMAARVAKNTLKKRAEAMKCASDLVLRELTSRFPDLSLNFRGVPRLPNTLSLRIPGITADDLVVALDLEGVLISSGAACASGKPEPSHVLLAMGFTDREARETIRISFSGAQSEQDLARAIQSLTTCISRMRNNGR